MYQKGALSVMATEIAAATARMLRIQTLLALVVRFFKSLSIILIAKTVRKAETK